MPWLTPDVTGEFMTRSFFIPREMSPFIRGVLTSLADARSWEAFGNSTPEQCAAIFEDLLFQQDNFMIGAIFPTLSPLLPSGCLWCEGQVLQVSDYPVLASLIDPTFIVGATIVLPDMRGRFIYGSDTIGTVGGEEYHTLTVEEMPSHSHGEHTHLPGQLTGEAPTQVPDFPIPELFSSRGGDEPHNNMPPFITVRFYIMVK